jgi:aminoglycoside 6'-N-acetyltransferase I
VVPNHFRIRHAQPTDLEQWARLRSALWPDEELDVLRSVAGRFLAASPHGLGDLPEAVLVAVDGKSDSALLGFAEVSRRAYAEGCETSPVGFLEGWYVVPERCGQGVGRALVAAAERWARDKGCRESASDAVAENLDSALAHRALGFEEVQVIRCFRKDLPPER